MKIVALTITAVMAQGTMNNPMPIGNAAQCWECNAISMNDCEANGRLQDCRPTQGHQGKIFSSSSCATTIRKREGEVYFVSMGCKDTEACVKQHVSHLYN